MSALKKLAAQTAIYGLPTIVGRLLNYLLVPLQTYIFLPDQYGIVGELYAWTSLLFVVLTYGMETAFFRFSQNSEQKESVFSTIVISLLTTSLLFVVVASSLSPQIAGWLRFENYPQYITWMAIIVAIDAFTSVLFAQLRLVGKAIKFAKVRFVNILINIVLNLFFLALCPYLHQNHILPELVNVIYDPSIGIGYIFIANLAASAVTLLLLLPAIIKMKWNFDWQLWKKMMNYAFPLMIFGLAGIVNETMDRVLIKFLAPEAQAQAMVGVYSACYKISILMTIFIQAFKYAAEPFFFSRAKDKDAKKLYADVMDVFVMVCATLFIGVMLYLDIVQYFVGEDYRVGLSIVPILLIANLFSGIFYNLSIWYKLSDKTKYGAYISIVGAIITLTFNMALIPALGYMGAAWTTLICYFSMAVISYICGQKHYPIQYPIMKITFYIVWALVIYMISKIYCSDMVGWTKYAVHTLLLLLYAAGTFWGYKKIKNEFQAKSISN